MCRPRPIEGDQPTRVDSPAKDIFGHEFAFVPDKKLAKFAIDGMLSLADATKPVPVSVIAVFEPFVNKHVGRIVVEAFADKFAHPEMRLFSCCRVTLRHVDDEEIGAIDSGTRSTRKQTKALIIDSRTRATRATLPGPQAICDFPFT